MNDDMLDPINSLNMPEMADTSLALDFLIRAKESVRNYAIALTEAASADVRAALRLQLQEAIALHEETAALMIRKGWFYPYDLSKQAELDRKSADSTVKIAQMDLFPEDTSRKGMFDRTPD